MESLEPDIEGYLIKLDDVPLDEILQRRDGALTHAVRRIVESTSGGPHDVVAAFNNYI